MNVFALLGKVDGKAPLEFTIDGDDALNQLGLDCSPAPPPRNPLCGALEGRDVTVPIVADFTGNTYGIGMVLAGGWNNYAPTWVWITKLNSIIRINGMPFWAGIMTFQNVGRYTRNMADSLVHGKILLLRSPTGINLY